MVKTGCLIICLFACFIARTQDFSNKGKDFWVTFPAHVDATSAVMGIYITSDAAANGQVQFATTSIPFSITPNTVKRIFIGPNGDAANDPVYLNQQDGIAQNAGIHVTSDAPVVVYAHIIKQARSGASLILPTPVWGKEYLVPSHGSAGQSGVNSGIGIITVVAKEANTVVEITPKAQSLSGRQQDVPYTITLNQPGDVYQVQFEKDADISGSKVRSIASGTTGCKPIAVFSASTWSAFDCLGASGGDNLFQQLFPTRSFGKSFVTAPFFHRNYDIIRVFVTDPATVVKRTENGATSILSGLQNNSFYEFTTDLPNKIDADKPISVVQYITSQSCYTNSVHADPEMVLLNSTDQTLDNITVFSAHQNFVPPGQSNVDECYLNIIIKTIAAPSFRISGALPLSGFQAIPGTAFSFLQENVTSISATNPVQTLSADSGFAAIAYGYGNVESYGYNAGCNVRDLYQYITIKNDNATVNFPATCVNTPFQFGIVLPYAATHLKWLFYGKFADVDIPNPVADSTFVLDGKTLNRYRLPKSYNYPSIGTFKVSVIATNATSDGCNGEQQIDYDVQVFENPKAKFTLQHSGCLANSVHFTDATDGLGRTVNRWLWQFGDNTTSALKNPAKKYTQAGTYTIKESIITDVGCLADTSATIQISTPPNAIFTITPPFCSGGKIKLTDNSTIAGGTIVKWYWDFGNGKKDTTITNDPVFAVYSNTGTYKITLIVESNSGCRSQLTEHEITITPGPIADFTPPAAICLPGAPAAFKNLSTVSDGTTAQLKYAWDFGDGGTDNTIDPSHSYLAGGPFTVTLTVTSISGCIKDTSKVLNNIYAQPKAEFDLPSTACLHDISHFKDQSIAANQSLVQYFWNFGDNSTSPDKDPAKTYAAAAPYQVKHWAISDKGCPSDTVEKTYTINPPPTAAFTLDASACKDKQVTFTSQSVSNGGSIERWYWNLGDGTIQDETTGDPFGHVYTSTGVKNVSLTVTTDQGCKSDTLRKNVQVNLLPLPDFGLPEVCLSDAFAEFTDSSKIDDGTESQFTYLWDFGDPNATPANPNTSTDKTPRHRYSAAGNYNVTLEVSSKDGCSASVVKSLTVNGSKPKADFTVSNSNNLCSNSMIEIADASSVDFGSITKTEIYWEWPSTTEKTLDDDPTPGKTYQHQYTDFQNPSTRTFTIHYLAYSGGVCVNEINKDVVINATPKILFQQIPGICVDATPRLITQASDLAGLPGNGIYSGTSVSPGGLFDPVVGEGAYPINYLFVSNAGCRDSASQEITVWKKPIADFIADAPACIGKPVTFSDNSDPIIGKVVQWNWTLGDGTTDNRTNGAPFQKSYSTGGSVDVQLQVTTDSGCVSSITTKPITINPLPAVDFDLPAVVCLPAGKAQFTDRSTIADGTESQFTYLWTSGVGSASSTLKDPFFNYTSVASYNVKLQVTSKDGCINSLSKTLTNIIPQALANFIFTPAAACLGEPIEFTDKSNPLSETVVAWKWNFDDGTESDQQNITHRFTQSGIFKVKFFYTTQKGCYSDTVIKPVLIHRIPIVDAGPDLAVLEGGQVILRAKATGGTNYKYNWSPSTWLNSTTIAQPVSSPHDDITYILTVTGEGDCTASDDVFVKLLLTPVIPNAFSPNGDGINDVWNIKNLGSYTDCNVNVFDRYGRQVFNSIGYSKPWDGTSHGALLPVGVYYYIIEPKSGKGPLTGSVTILH